MIFVLFVFIRVKFFLSMTENELILTSLLDCHPIDLYLNRVTLTEGQERILADIKSRRDRGEPLQYILGACEFFGMKIKVDTRVLIPRPETEILVQESCQYLNQVNINLPLEILELGSGSGNIAICLARELKKASITSVDISQEALSCAESNARMNALDSKIRFIHQDMRDFLTECILSSRNFDVIISNPPYIPSDQISNLQPELQWEPRLALEGGEDGLEFIRSIVCMGKEVIRTGGVLFLEIGDGQADPVKEIFSQYDQYEDIQFIEDYTQTKRIVRGRIWKS